MTVPLVSVALPVHNGAPHVAEAVESLLAQTHADFELVLCDDGSTDATSEICADLAQRDARIRLLRRSSKSGVSAAANWAVSEASAPLVAIAHADDLSHPDRLARQVALMQANPDCVLTGSPATAIDWHGRPAHPPNLWRLAYPGAFAPMAHSSILFRKDAFDRIGGYRGEADYWEDLDLYWRLARCGRILVSTQPVTTYRYSRISIRQREGARDVERALATMYDCADAVATGRQPDLSGAASPKARIHPRIFVARSWSRVWAGERAEVLTDLLRRGRLRPNRDTIESLGFVAWATISPRSLRAALRLATRLRNRRARKRLGDAEAIEWHPGPKR